MESLDTMYEEVYFRFREINPKRYSQLTFYEVDKQEDLKLYLEEGLVIKYNEIFYKCQQLSRLVRECPQHDTKIEFKHRRTTKNTQKTK